MDIKQIISLLLSQRGEVGDEIAGTVDVEAQDSNAGTGEATVEVDPFQAAKDALTSQQQDQDTTQAATADKTQGEDTFLQGSDLDPRKLPPEIQPIFKRMQAVYTKKFQEYGSLKEKAETVDRFYSDPAFAQQTLVGWAAQNGYQLVPVGGQQAPIKQGTNGATQGAVPSVLVDAVKSKLPEEMAWMAEPIAAAMGSSMQELLSPVLTQQQQAQQQARVQEWEKHADELRGVAPGWEEHEDVMSELFDYFSSDAQFHPKFGSKLQLLYNLATGQAAAMKTATDRVNSAAKNRVSSGRSGASRVPAIGDQIAKAKTNQDAWELAKQHALQQINKQPA